MGESTSGRLAFLSTSLSFISVSLGILAFGLPYWIWFDDVIVVSISGASSHVRMRFHYGFWRYCNDVTTSIQSLNNCGAVKTHTDLEQLTICLAMLSIVLSVNVFINTCLYLCLMKNEKLCLYVAAVSGIISGLTMAAAVINYGLQDHTAKITHSFTLPFSISNLSTCFWLSITDSIVISISAIIAVIALYFHTDKTNGYDVSLVSREDDQLEFGHELQADARCVSTGCVYNHSISKTGTHYVFHDEPSGHCSTDEDDIENNLMCDLNDKHPWNLDGEDVHRETNTAERKYEDSSHQIRNKITLFSTQLYPTMPEPITRDYDVDCVSIDTCHTSSNAGRQMSNNTQSNHLDKTATIDKYSQSIKHVTDVSSLPSNGSRLLTCQPSVENDGSQKALEYAMSPLRKCVENAHENDVMNIGQCSGQRLSQVSHCCQLPFRNIDDVGLNRSDKNVVVLDRKGRNFSLEIAEVTSLSIEINDMPVALRAASPSCETSPRCSIRQSTFAERLHKRKMARLKKAGDADSTSNKDSIEQEPLYESHIYKSSPDLTKHVPGKGIECNNDNVDVQINFKSHSDNKPVEALPISDFVLRSDVPTSDTKANSTTQNMANKGGNLQQMTTAVIDSQININTNTSNNIAPDTQTIMLDEINHYQGDANTVNEKDTSTMGFSETYMSGSARSSRITPTISKDSSALTHLPNQVCMWDEKQSSIRLDNLTSNNQSHIKQNDVIKKGPYSRIKQSFKARVPIKHSTEKSDVFRNLAKIHTESSAARIDAMTSISGQSSLRGKSPKRRQSPSPTRTTSRHSGKNEA